MCVCEFTSLISPLSYTIKNTHEAKHDFKYACLFCFLKSQVFHLPADVSGVRTYVMHAIKRQKQEWALKVFQCSVSFGRKGKIMTVLQSYREELLNEHLIKLHVKIRVVAYGGEPRVTNVTKALLNLTGSIQEKFLTLCLEDYTLEKKGLPLEVA